MRLRANTAHEMWRRLTRLPTRDEVERWIPWALVALAIAVLAIHASTYFPFLSDDALISLRYAERWVGGKGLTWTDGPRVEGYSDWLWVVLIAGARALRIDSVAAARGLDFIGASAAIVFAALSPVTLRLRWERAVTGGLALALLAPLAVWSIGGLEHGFMAGLIAGSLWSLSRALSAPSGDVRSAWAVSAFLAAIAVCRVDGPIFTVAAVLAVLILRRPFLTAIKTAAVTSALPVAAYGAQTAFRWTYYGALLPNTARAKINFNSERVELGLRHVATGLTAVWPLLVAVGLVTVVLWASKPRAWLVAPVLYSLLWIAYLAAVGGDIFPGWRQLLLGLVPLAVALANAAELARESSAPRALWLVPTIAAFGALSVSTQSRDVEDQRAKIERWEWDGYQIGPLLQTAFGARAPLLAVDAAGALPYWSGLPSLDMLGLNDAYIAAHPPPSFGHGGIGHELGDGHYVFQREPDIIAFNNAAGYHDPLFLSGRQMLAMGRTFTSRYQLVVVASGGIRGELWVRREGGKLGLQRSEDRVELQGYFLGSYDAPATLDAARHLSVVVSETGIGQIPGLRLEPGVWIVEFEPHSLNLALGFGCNGTSANAGEGDVDSIAVGPSDLVDVRVATTGGGALIQKATFRRVGRYGEPAKYHCARGRITVPATALLEPKQTGSAWNAPSNVLFSGSGLRVALAMPSHSRWIHVSRDNNDDYAFAFRLSGREVGRTLLPAAMSGGGLATARVTVPPPAVAAGFDEIIVEPGRGDGSFSLGHLVLGP